MVKYWIKNRFLLDLIVPCVLVLLVVFAFITPMFNAIGEATLMQSIYKNEKMDFLVQKVSELGITKIVPVITERTVVKIVDAKKEEKKQERWQKIALEACKQCGRSRIPEITKAVKLKEAQKYFSACDETSKTTAFIPSLTISRI